MDFAEALAFSKTFPDCNPKIFKGFQEWGVYDKETEGYVVLTAEATNFSRLNKYVKRHRLRIEHLKNYLMILTV